MISELLKSKVSMSLFADKVAEFKQLKGGVRFVPTIPRNESGKILKQKLQDSDQTH